MAWQELKRIIQTRLQPALDYLDRRKIIDPSLRTQIASFDLLARGYYWPVHANEISFRSSLFQSLEPNAVRTFFSQAVELRIIRTDQEPGRSVVLKRFRRISKGSARAFTALLWQLERLSYPDIATGEADIPWEKALHELAVAAGKSNLLKDIHPPTNKISLVAAPKIQSKEEKQQIASGDVGEDILNLPGRFFTPPSFSKRAIQQLQQWTPDSLMEFAQRIPRIPETAGLPEELATFTNFYLRLKETLQGINTTRIHDDIDNLSARPLLSQIAREISRLPDERRTLYYLASYYANLVKQRSIEELKERIHKPKQK